MKDNISVYDKDGNVSKEYSDYVEEQGKRIKQRYANFDMEAKQRGIGMRTDNKPITLLLDEMASKVGDYYFLPYWFRVSGDTIIAYHLEDLPEDLKQLIELNRQKLSEEQ